MSREAVGIQAFFSKTATDPLTVHAEAQRMKNCIESCEHLKLFDNPAATFDCFRTKTLDARRKNVRIVHLAGHCTKDDGFLWLKTTDGEGVERKRVNMEDFCSMVWTEAINNPLNASSTRGIECVLLNACETFVWGRKLQDLGLQSVICWDAEIDDRLAANFADWFYESLCRGDEDRLDYRKAYEHALLRMGTTTAGRIISKVKKPHNQDANSCASLPIFLGRDNGESLAQIAPAGLPRTVNQAQSAGHSQISSAGSSVEVNQESPVNPTQVAVGEQAEHQPQISVSRNIRQPRNPNDHAAWAGHHECVALAELGFRLEFHGQPISEGNGLDPQGFPTSAALQTVFKISSYSELWGDCGKVVVAARKKMQDCNGQSDQVAQCLRSLQKAREALGSALQRRNQNPGRHVSMKKSYPACSQRSTCLCTSCKMQKAHTFMRDQIESTHKTLTDIFNRFNFLHGSQEGSLTNAGKRRQMEQNTFPAPAGARSEDPLPKARKKTRDSSQYDLCEQSIFSGDAKLEQRQAGMSSKNSQAASQSPSTTMSVCPSSTEGHCVSSNDKLFQILLQLCCNQNKKAEELFKRCRSKGANHFQSLKRIPNGAAACITALIQCRPSGVSDAAYCRDIFEVRFFNTFSDR
mmetsp:Transcript_15382/g.23947  ORF Transcript_15382/g.23947 Transcript_15382/m.23947 type:complete len:636 (-) Transcript_15382:883-2790(-)